MADQQEARLPQEVGSSWLYWSLIFVFLVWAGSGFAVSHFFNLADSAGEFGDMFGAINALFSGFAFAGLIYTILLQRQELGLQRNELVLTRDELAGQKKALNDQNATLQKQNFENTFFQLLRLQNDIVNAIDIRSGGVVTVQGRDCFKTFYQRFFNIYANHATGDLQNIEMAYSAFFERNQADVGHYFRSLYTLVKFVDRSDVPDKKFYTNIVRAQLSSFELALLFYNGLSSLGREKFKRLIQEYALLKTVPTAALHQMDMALYDPAAFGF